MTSRSSWSCYLGNRPRFEAICRSLHRDCVDGAFFLDMRNPPELAVEHVTGVVDIPLPEPDTLGQKRKFQFMMVPVIPKLIKANLLNGSTRNSDE